MLEARVVEEMGGVTLCNNMHRYYYHSFLAMLLCSCFLHPSQAFYKLHGHYDEEKVPLTVIVPDASPQPAPLAEPPAVPGVDEMPRLPSERWRPGSPSGNADAPAVPLARGPAAADAPAPAVSGSSATFISSSPAVPLPRGVTDSATVMPIPTTGHERQDVGMGALVQARIVPLLLPLVMTFCF